MEKIRLVHGVSIPNTFGVCKEFKRIACDNVSLTLSAEDYKAFFDAAVSKLKEPLFFFIEVPEGDSEDYDTYYLDDLKVSVAKAILKRYGGILYSDGIVRFGFGSHKTEDEIYMREFQLLNIYANDTSRFTGLLEKLGYSENADALTLWDVLSDDNPGTRECVECDDEGYPDIIANLGELGLYKSE